MTIAQFRRVLVTAFVLFTQVHAVGTPQPIEMSKEVTKELALFKDFDDQPIRTEGDIQALSLIGSNPIELQNDFQALIERLKADAIRQQQEIREQHLKVLPADARALVEEALQGVSVVANNLRLQNTIGMLAYTIANQPKQTDECKQALHKLEDALRDGSFQELFFSNISNNAQDKAVAATAVWGHADLKGLLKLLEKAESEQTITLRDILTKMHAKNYAAAARACYNINAPAIKELEKVLHKTSNVLVHLTETIAKGDIVQHKALEYWTKQVTKHLHTMINVQKAAAKATIDISWVLYTMSHVYDVFEPYFMLNGFSFAHLTHGRSPSSVWVQDVCLRSGLAFAAMAQHHFDSAGRDITQLIIGDSSLAHFVDPLNEGVGIAALGGVLTKLQKHGMTLFAGAQLFNKPTMYAMQMSQLARFGMRFVCAFAWYNLGNFKDVFTFEEDGTPRNKALTADVYRAIIRFGIFSLQGYVSGMMESAIYNHVSRERMYDIENATMGVVSPRILSEFMDVCITWCLMQRHPVINDYIARFNDFDIHGYNNRWYFFDMMTAYAKMYPNGGVTHEAFFKQNQNLFLEYSALYYVFGSIGRHWARKGAAANIEALASGLSKVGMKVASWLFSEDEVMLLGYSKEIVVNMLQAMIQDVMHTAGSQQRRAAIDFMRSVGMISPDLHDDQKINDAMMIAFLDYFFMMGIFDYKQTMSCLEDYKKHKDDLVEFVPLLVDKVGHGILISLSGFVGRQAGYKMAEWFFRKPSGPQGQAAA